mmetsp:Transcript_9346/g.14130  ORF Transcript_9346/g.14130 Transcript_9346/m.14130 type:complete len:140 (+) Transcript_9346:2060-2479(+)
MQFESIPLTKKYPFSIKLAVPEMKANGGKPSCPFFYKNPQFSVTLDTDRITVDKQKMLSVKTNLLLTYTDTFGSSVRLFLLKPGICDNTKNHKGRVSHVDSKNFANPSEEADAYRQGEGVATAVLEGPKHYTAIISAFE